MVPVMLRACLDADRNGKVPTVPYRRVGVTSRQWDTWLVAETLSRERPRRLPFIGCVAILAALVLGGCGGLVDGGDQWFNLTVRNDTGSTVVIREPCPDCRQPEFLAKVRDGQSYRIPVLANGGSKTYRLDDETGTTLGCLPLVYAAVPARKTVTLSSAERPCTG